MKYLVPVLIALVASGCATNAASNNTARENGQPPSENAVAQPEQAQETARGDKGLLPYPLDTCIVTDNKLGSMGDPVTLVHGNQEVKICCSPCESQFRSDPELYLTKLADKAGKS